MKLSIVAASNRQPQWVEDAFDHYARRFSGGMRLQYKQLRLSGQRETERRLADEGKKLLAAVPAGADIIVLDQGGESWSTRKLAGLLEGWMADATQPCFVIGGPDGLAPAVFAAARYRWSLSALTLPHALARILVAEALYRSFSVLSGHPYHRE